MTNSIERRDLIKTGIVVASAAFCSPLIKPFTASAQFSSVLNFALADEPLQMLVALFELAGSLHSRQDTTKTMNDIADQLNSIAVQQGRILQQLADLRIIMSQEIRQGFLDNDVRELHAAAQNFKIALVSDDRTRDEKLRNIVERMDGLATKISDFGLPAVPAYLTAITLQNGAHYVLGSLPSVFITINQFHHQTLSRLLHEDGPGTLSHFVKYSLNPLVADGSSTDAQKLLTDFGRGYAFALVSKKYEVTDYTKPEPASTFEYGYSYEGFRNGQPVFKEGSSDVMYGKYQGVSGYDSNVRGKKVKSANIWFGAINESGINQSAIDYRNIPGLLPKPTAWGSAPEADLEIDSKGTIFLDDSSLKIIQGQLNALTAYYLRSYDPSMGDITSESVKKIQASQEEMRQLLTRGLGDVDRILALERNEPVPVIRQ